MLIRCQQPRVGALMHAPHVHALHAPLTAAPALQELRESKDRLLGRVHTLKSELTDWRGRLDEQMNAYRTELGDLRKHLNTEVDGLREQFAQLQGTIHTQLEATKRLADTEGSTAAKQSVQGYRSRADA